MTFSKKCISVLGIVIIWLFALLNRIHVYCISEVIPAKVYQMRYSASFVLIFEYKGVTYQKISKEDILLDNDTDCKILVKGKDPNNFTVLNFWDFVFGTIVISIFLTLVWLIFVLTFFENIVAFQLLFRKKDEK
ncbi:MAG: hypothetical protein LBE13_10415 [Bacteroidales bacterium]|jgi:hypothetical protein|nr:hypothetical protein [Bacteroidales bacterium]